jgi:hypothetical protein
MSSITKRVWLGALAIAIGLGAGQLTELQAVPAAECNFSMCYTSAVQDPVTERYTWCEPHWATHCWLYGDDLCGQETCNLDPSEPPECDLEDPTCEP